MFEIDNAIENGNNLYKLNANGRYEFAYADDVLLEVQNAFAQNFADLNLDPSTPQGQIITFITEMINAGINYNVDTLNAFFFGGKGQFLDGWAWNAFRLQRKGSTYSTVVLKFTGTPNYVIPANFETNDGTQSYKNITQLTLDNDGIGYVTAQAITINDHIATPDTITNFEIVDSNIATVTNPLESTQSVYRESDTDLFNRAYNFGSTAANTTWRSILAKVNAVEGVTKVDGYENYTNNPIVYKGIETPPHSITLVVEGGVDEDIANAMCFNRPPGTDMLGNVTVDLNIDGTIYPYTFYRPVIANFKVAVAVQINTTSPRNYETLIRDNIINFFNKSTIGDLITQPALAQATRLNLVDIDIVDVQFGRTTSAIGYAPIQLNLIETGYLTRDDIIITVV